MSFKKKVFLTTVSAVTAISTVTPAYANELNPTNNEEYVNELNTMENITPEESNDNSNNDENFDSEEVKEDIPEEIVGESDSEDSDNMGLIAPTSTNVNDGMYENYRINPETGTILEYIGTEKNVVVPSEIGGIPIKTIGSLAYANKGITSVVISEGIEVIETGAFQNNYGLNSVTLPQGLREIKAQGFLNSNLTQIDLPESLTLLGDLSFKGSRFTEIDLPESLITIGDEVFYGSSISEFIGGENLENIGFRAFYQNKFENLVLPNSVVYIGGSAFSSNKIKTYTLSSNLKHIGSSFLFDNPVESHELVLPNTVETIEGYAFENLSITQLTLSSNLKTIGDSAFRANSIPNLVIPDTTETIGKSAFAESRIETVKFGENLRMIGERAFFDNLISEVNFKDNLEEVDSMAFYKNRITELDLGNSVKRIGSGAFSSDASNVANVTKRNSIRSIVIPDSLEILERSAFVNNFGLTTLEFGEDSKLKRIEQLAFDNSNISELIIPKSIERIDHRAFYNTPLSKLEFAEDSSLTVLESDVFNSTRGQLKELILPSGLVEIGIRNFLGHKIETLVLPDTLTSIGDQTFKGNKITSLTIPGSVRSIGNEAFQNNIISELILEDGLQSIGPYSFAGNPISSLSLPNTLKSISNHTFTSATLTNLVIPENVYYIGENAFKGVGIETLILPESLETIEKEAFANNKIETLVLPSQLKVIGNSAFINNRITGHIKVPGSITYPYFLTRHNPVSAFANNKITSVEVEGPLANITSSMFANNNIETLTLSEGLVEISSSAFANNSISLINIPSTVESIGSSAFFNNELEELVLPDNVKMLGTNAFGSNNIENLYISKGLKVLSSEAFFDNQLRSVTIPKNVETIGSEVFRRNPIEEIKVLNPSAVFNARIFHRNGDPFVPGNITIHGYLNSTAKAYATSNNHVFEEIQEGAIDESLFNFDESTQTINGFSGEDYANIIIPETIRGIEVLHIGNGVFKDYDFISLKLPENLESIGNEAFKGNKFTSVTFNSSLKAIGDNAFEDNLIETLNFGDGDLESIGKFAFANNKLKNLTLPNSLISIDEDAFVKNTIENLILGNQLQTIGARAFAGEAVDSTYGRLTTFNRLTTNKISSIIIPDSVVDIGEAAFKHHNASTIQIGSGLTEIKNEVFYKGARYPQTITIPFNVKEIGNRAFEAYTNTSKITTLIGHAELSKMGSRAFAYQSISNFEFSPLLTVIEDGVFLNNAFTNLIIPDTVTNVKASAFGENKIKTLVLGDSLIEIGHSSFRRNPLTTLDLGNSIEIIGDYAFGYSDTSANFWRDIPENYKSGSISNITELNIPSSLRIIGEAAFSGNEITDLVIPETVESVGPWAFSSNLISNLTLPENFKEVKSGAFAFNELVEIDLPESLEMLESHAFRGNKLTSLVVPGTVETIGNYAFHSNLISSLILSDSVKNLGFYSFYQNELVDLDLNKVQDVGAFSFDRNKIERLKLNEVIMIKDFAFQKNKIKHLILPDTTTTIFSGAFYQNGMEKLILGKGMREFPKGNVNISDDIGAFEDNLLKHLIIPEGLRMDGGSYRSYQSNVFHLNDITTVVSFEDRMWPHHKFNKQRFNDNSKVVIYGTPGSQLESRVNSDSNGMNSGWNGGRYTFRSIAEFNMGEFLKLYEDLGEEFSYLTLEYSRERVSRNNYNVLINGYSNKEEVQITVGDKGTFVVPVTNGTYTLTVPYENITETQLVNIIVTDGIREEKGNVRLDFEESYLQLQTQPVRISKNKYYVYGYGYTNEEYVNIYFDGEVQRIKVDSSGYYEAQVMREITEDTIVEVRVENGVNSPIEREVLLKHEGEEDFNVNITQNRRPDNFIDVTVGLQTNGAFSIVYWHVIPKIINENGDSIPIPQPKGEPFNLSRLGSDGVWIETEETNYTLKEIDFLSDDGFDVELARLSEKDLASVDFNDESTFLDYTLIAEPMQGPGSRDFIFPNKIYEDTSVWAYILSYGQTGGYNLIMKRVDLKYLPDGIESGTVEVEYLDEYGNILDSKSVLNVEVGVEHFEEAIEIPGYTLIDDNRKSVTLNEHEEVGVIQFYYQSEASIGGPADDYSGIVTVNYVDENGNVLRSKTETDLSLGTHYEQAIEIPGYILNDDNEKSVIIEENSLEHEITFLYKKESQIVPEPTDPEPTDPEPTDPEPTDPEPTDPEPTDPEPTDPEPTDPEPTDPEPTDPEPTDPEPIDPEPTDPEPTDPEPTNPEPTDPEPTDPEPTDPEPTDPEPTDPEPTDPEPTDPEPTDPEPTDPEPTDPEPTDPEPTDPEDEVFFGSVFVKYVDENGNVIYSKTVVALPLGTHKEKAAEFNGYSLNDKKEKSIIINKNNLHHEITFLYKKDKEDAPPAILGNLNVSFIDLHGQEISPSIAKEIPLGEHTEVHMSIEGYEIQSKPSVTINVTEDRLKHNIVFVYKKIEKDSDKETPLPPKTGDGSIPDSGKMAGGVLSLAMAALGLHFLRRKKKQEGK